MANYPLQLQGNNQQPYIRLKRGLLALINRAVFYDLIEIAIKQKNVSQQNDDQLWLTSANSKHSLGKLT